MKVLVVVAACLAAAQADSCPNLSAVQHFDLTKFVGTWYSNAVLTADTKFLEVSSCIKEDYSLDSTPGVLKVVNSAKVYGTDFTTEATGELADPTKAEGNLKITVQTGTGNKTDLLSCISTDYENFAIFYTCIDTLGEPVHSASVMTRTQELKDAEKVKVEALITAAFTDIVAQGGPAYEDFCDVTQTNCN